MKSIILICTVHEEHGNCNSGNLSEIFSRINPDIIFQEISYNFYTEKYHEQSKEILEIQAINKYINHKNTVLVDVDNVEMTKSISEYFDKAIIKTVKIFPSANELFQNQYELECLNGFKILNSKEINLFNRKLEKLIISTKKEDILSNYKIWKSHNDKREINMIENIYRYSKNNEYKKAIFLIGSGHRGSIIKLIQKYKKNSPIKINWRFNGYKNIL